MFTLPPSWYGVAKRTFDLVAAVLGLVVLCFPLLLIMAAVKLSSPGPVFYRGKRTGLNGKPFRIYKFRTMVVNAEQIGGTLGCHAALSLRMSTPYQRYLLTQVMSAVIPRSPSPADAAPARPITSRAATKIPFFFIFNSFKNP